MFYSLDVWHKSNKVTAKVSEVLNFLVYSGTSLIRTSLNRNLANPNGNALVNFFFFNFFFF